MPLSGFAEAVTLSVCAGAAMLDPGNPVGAPQTPAASDVDALHVPSPDWRDQVIYSLMIDRFDDGDPQRNDQGAHEYDPHSDAYFSGGDLKGVTRRIDYLTDLGVTAVWISPPTATQWWDPATRYTGYHGYWPVNFREVDAHFGALADYQALSRALHRRGMYLIQDAVVNQIGHYYNYAGGYHPENNRINFHLNIGAIPPKPTMAPFDRVNVLNPADATADAYHWTPSITDYADPSQQYTHQLQLMNDINTSNPVVRKALKDAYGYWIQQVGVDALRLDATKHVEFDFLRDFLHGPGGIVESAQATGRHDFLTFGEIFNFSDPLATNGEEKISPFRGTPDRPLLRAVINFPLYEEMQRVFAGGMPTSYLAFRLAAQRRYFGEPNLAPTFVDNHDVERFLAGGTIDAYRQAYTLILTTPGIPTIYQGDEQGFTDVRRTMFKGGYLGVTDGFDRSSPMFGFLKKLIAIRRDHVALRRGSLSVLAENATGAGVLAFKREAPGETVFVILNTSSTYATLLNAMPTGLAPGTQLEVLHARGIDTVPTPDGAGRLTLVLPRYAALILRASPAQPLAAAGSAPAPVTIDPLPPGRSPASGDRICGRTARPSTALSVVANGNIDTAEAIMSDRVGRWCARLPSVSLDRAPAFVELYDATLGVATPPLTFQSNGLIRHHASYRDAAGDDRGPGGHYALLTDDPSHHAADIRGASVRTNGNLLELRVTVGEIKNVWSYINKFDHMALSIFIDSGGNRGARALPLLNATMPDGRSWTFSHRLFGMGSTLYAADGASAMQFGQRLDSKPQLTIDYTHRTFTVTYDRSAMGLQSWSGVRFYITSWDADEFGRYRPIGATASASQFGGGTATAPRIFDDLAFAIPASGRRLPRHGNSAPERQRTR